MIKKENRAEYYDVLDLAHTTMNYRSFLKIVSDRLIESETLWLSMLD
ncbi:hypothetical protein LLG10_02370 [bacterium]|nr:hypothetical protein [bacterium]